MPLDINLDLARRAVDYARHHVTLIPNQMMSDADSPLLKLLDERIEFRENLEFSPKTDLTRLFGTLSSEVTASKTLAEKARISGVGNCGHLSHLAFDFLRQQGPASIPYEIFTIVDGDHMFIVIGRLPGSDENDPSTWGPDAVVCDPWAHRCYPASQTQGLLQCYVSDPATRQTHIYDYDPTINYLAVDVSTQAATLDELIDSRTDRYELFVRAIDTLLYYAGGSQENRDIFQLPTDIPVKAQSQPAMIRALGLLKQKLLAALGEQVSQTPNTFRSHTENQNKQILSLILSANRHLFLEADATSSAFLAEFCEAAKEELEEGGETETPSPSVDETLFNIYYENAALALSLFEDEEFMLLTSEQIYKLACQHKRFYEQLLVDNRYQCLEQRHIVGLKRRYDALSLTALPTPSPVPASAFPVSPLPVLPLVAVPLPLPLIGQSRQSFLRGIGGFALAVKSESSNPSVDSMSNGNRM